MWDHRRPFTFNTGDVTGYLNAGGDDQMWGGIEGAGGVGVLAKVIHLSDQKVGVGPKGPVKSLTLKVMKEQITYFLKN